MGRENLSLELPVTVPDNMPHLATVKAWIHVVQAVLTVLTVCVVAPVIAIEIKYYRGSQAAPNWALVVAVISCWVPVLLVYFPWAYDRKNKFKRIGKFCLKPRTNLIFTAFNSFIWATSAIAMTVHANNPVHCNLDSDLQDSDPSYTSDWTSQCNCAKAAAGLAWTTCIMWIATLICSVIIFWNEKQLIQKNLREHEMNKQATLQMQQQEQELQDEEAGCGYEYGRGPGYYESEEQPPHSVEEPLRMSSPKYEVAASSHPSPNTYYHPSPTPPMHGQPLYNPTTPEPMSYPAQTTSTPMPMPMPQPSYYSNHY